MANHVRDLRRQRFGRLVAITRVYENKDSYYWCVCDCGNEAKVRRGHLVDGTSKSCGCLQSEESSKKSWKGCGEISGTYWCDLSRNAKYRLKPLEITIEQAWAKFVEQGGRCAITGEFLTFYKRRKKERGVQTASLDRWDNTKGYTVDNICWVHKRVNRLKSDFSFEELKYWARKILDYDEVYPHHPETGPSP